MHYNIWYDKIRTYAEGPLILQGSRFRAVNGVIKGFRADIKSSYEKATAA